jgi:hypothetical protein
MHPRRVAALSSIVLLLATTAVPAATGQPAAPPAAPQSRCVAAQCEQLAADDPGLADFLRDLVRARQAENAAAGPPPSPSAELLAPLKAADSAIKAKQYDEAISTLRKAQAQNAVSEYDNYLINWSLAMSYYLEQKYEAAPLLKQLAGSRYTPPQMRKEFLGQAMAIYCYERNYPECIRVGEALMTVYQQEKDYSECIALGQELVTRRVATADIYKRCGR